MASEHKYNRLNAKQLNILALLYKFRFITIPLLTTYKGLKNYSTLTRNLRILEEQKLIGRTYSPSYKIDRRPAHYYLLPDGLAILKEDARFDPSVLHAYYKNRSLSDPTVNHYIDTLTVYNALRSVYGDAFEYFTKSEVSGFDDFPKNKPDLYLRGDKEYLLTLVHDMQPWLVRKRLGEYIDHSEEEGWTFEYPALLFVFDTAGHEYQFLEDAWKMLERVGVDGELLVATTTMKALSAGTVAIWTYATGEASEPVGLL